MMANWISVVLLEKKTSTNHRFGAIEPNFSKFWKFTSPP